MYVQSERSGHTGYIGVVLCTYRVSAQDTLGIYRSSAMYVQSERSGHTGYIGDVRKSERSGHSGYIGV